MTLLSTANLTAENSQPSSQEHAYLYVVGGRNRGQTLGVTERFDFKTNQWERGPHCVEPRGSHGLAAVGSRLFAISGGGIHSNLTSCESLDAAQCVGSIHQDNDTPHEWSFEGPIGVPRHALSACAVGDIIYAVGGWYNGNEAIANVDCLQCQGDRPYQWISKAPLNVPRRLHGVAGLSNGQLFCFGGRSTDDSSGPPLASVERYDPYSDKWTLHSTQLPAPACATATTCNDSIYVMLWTGQQKANRKKRTNNFFRYDTYTDSYIDLGTLPLPEWFGFAACSYKSSIFLVGGITQGRWTGATWAYDVDTKQWRELPRMKMVRRRAGAAIATIRN